MNEEYLNSKIAQEEHEKLEQDRLDKGLCPKCGNELTTMGDSGLGHPDDNTSVCEKCRWYDEDY